MCYLQKITKLINVTSSSYFTCPIRPQLCNLNFHTKFCMWPLILGIIKCHWKLHTLIFEPFLLIFIQNSSLQNSWNENQNWIWMVSVYPWCCFRNHVEVSRYYHSKDQEQILMKKCFQMFHKKYSQCAFSNAFFKI